MKIAIIHDWLVVNAGAEKVLKEIVALYPNADIFAIVDFLSEEDREKILQGKATHTSFVQTLPFAKKYFRYYLPFFPKAVQSFDLHTYDLIVSSSWAFAKGVKTHHNQVHICYCHTPIRYAWDMLEEYTKDLFLLKRFFVQISLNYIRRFDVKTSHSVDYFVANSHFVARRIKKIYNRDSIVIYPPVEISQFTLCEKKKEYYLSVSRLVGYKKTILIAEAFAKMPDKKLIIIGEGNEYKKIAKIATSNIELLGYQDTQSIVQYMQKAKAFVYCAIEDFGIAPVEAMACGTPVIALRQGGTAESVIDGVSGVHFAHQSVVDIVGAVESFEKKQFNPVVISQSAKKFSLFRDHFSAFVSKCLPKV